MVCGALLALASTAFSQDWLDRVDDALKVSAAGDDLRARLSGLVDAEGYYFEHPAPGLITTTRHLFFNPRLTLFLDGQAGAPFYFFAQSRVDRGFDPGDRGPGVRLDEYAVRFTPWQDGRLSLQIGKAATVFGTWTGRHLSWENPFTNAPLPYENVTAAAGVEPPLAAGPLDPVVQREKYQYLPVIWGPNYATGVSVAGRVDRFEYAAEVKNSALAARPESWDATNIGFRRPAFNGRFGFRPDLAWNLGFSASGGDYLRPEAAPALPRGTGYGDYRETVLGQDVGYSAGHWQVWAEFFESRFEIPRAGNLDAFSYYVEAKYKFTPQLFGALRWNQQAFTNAAGGASARDTHRIDAAAGYRFTAHIQWKLQYSYQSGGVPLGNGGTVSTQFTTRF